MSNPTPMPSSGDSRAVSLVIKGTDPARHVLEFLNSLTEDEERAVLAFLADHLPLLTVSREIADQLAESES